MKTFLPTTTRAGSSFSLVFPFPSYQSSSRLAAVGKEKPQHFWRKPFSYLLTPLVWYLEVRKCTDGILRDIHLWILLSCLTCPPPLLLPTPPCLLECNRKLLHSKMQRYILQAMINLKSFNLWILGQATHCEDGEQFDGFQFICFALRWVFLLFTLFPVSMSKFKHSCCESWKYEWMMHLLYFFLSGVQYHTTHHKSLGVIRLNLMNVNVACQGM